MFGLGYAHATDRLLAMAINRIAAEGRAAELLEDRPGLLEQDRWVRRLGLVQGAERDEATARGAMGLILRAYCDGVQARLDEPGKPWPLALLGLDERPWTPRDCMLVLRLLAWASLSQQQEVTERLVVGVLRDGTKQDVAALRGIYAPFLDDVDPALVRAGPWGKSVSEPPALSWDPLCSAALPGLAGSNAWAIAGWRSTTGGALLCNDPHLEAQSLPATFYEVALVGGASSSLGITVPGLPGVLAGRFTHVAAAVTAGFLDQVDLFVEECRDGTVRRGGRWEPLQRRVERLRRKGTDEVEELEVWSSSHGVIEGTPLRPGRYLARAWVADRATLAPALGVGPALEEARDLDEALRACARMPLSINYVLADEGGRIGLQQAGIAPRRKRGTGLAPRPGWDPTWAWGGLESPSRLARLDATEQGWIATANDFVAPPGGSEALFRTGGTPTPEEALVTAALPGYRRQRLARLIDGRAPMGPAQFRAPWQDRVDPRAQRYLQTLRPLLPRSARGQALASWDGTYAPQLRAPVFYERVRASLLRAVWGGFFDRAAASLPAVALDPLDDGLDLPADADRLWLEGNSLVLQGRGYDDELLDPRSPIWAGRDRETILRAAIAAGLARPAQKLSQARRYRRSWLLVSGSKAAELGFASRTEPVDGSEATLHQGRIMRTAGRIVVLAPLWRFFADLSERTIHTALNGGPGDQPLSRWYANERAAFARGETKEWGP